MVHKRMVGNQISGFQLSALRLKLYIKHLLTRKAFLLVQPCIPSNIFMQNR